MSNKGNRRTHALDEVMGSLGEAMRRATPDLLKNIC